MASGHDPEMRLESRLRVWDSPASEAAGVCGDEGASSVPMPSDADITGLLRLAASGDTQAETSLFELLYDDLKRQATRLMRRQQPGHALQATDVLHEAWVRVARGAEIDWKDRGHFFAVAARAMRRVLIDHARAKCRLKRDDGRIHVPLDAVALPFEERGGDLLALDEALDRLAVRDPGAAAIVEMKFFGGFTMPEIAEARGVSLRKAERDWEHARAWLLRELSR